MCPLRRTPPWQPRPLRSAVSALLLVLGLVVCAGALPSAQAEPPPAEPAAAVTDAARRHAIRGLKSRLRKLANSAHAANKRDEIDETLESLFALGGVEAGEAALEAVVLTDGGLRDRVFALVEREHDEKLIEPLVQLLEGNEHRRDADLRRRIAHALAVMSHESAVVPLADLLRFDEEAEVVAEACASLATYAAAPLKDRKEAVRRLVDLYETTWNYKMSVRPEDKTLSRIASGRWGVYSQVMRTALQTLTGEQLSRPLEWRRWWNDNKKRPTWDREDPNRR